MAKQTPPEDTRRLAQVIENPVEGWRTTIGLAQELNEDGPPVHVLRVERELIPGEPPEESPRRESKARAHTFFAVAGFIDYLSKYGGADTVIFADPVRGVIQAVLDEAAPLGKEQIVLRPQIHPRWAPFRAALGSKVPIEDLAQFVRENRRAIENGRLLIGELRQITCATEITLHQGVATGKTTAVNGLVIKTKIGSGPTTEGLADLPEEITVLSPIFVDTEPQKIVLDLVLGASREGTNVWGSFSSADLREAEIVAFDALVARLRETPFVVTYGSTEERDWARV